MEILNIHIKGMYYTDSNGALYQLVSIGKVGGTKHYSLSEDGIGVSTITTNIGKYSPLYIQLGDTVINLISDFTYRVDTITLIDTEIIVKVRASSSRAPHRLSKLTVSYYTLLNTNLWEILQ